MKIKAGILAFFLAFAVLTLTASADTEPDVWYPPEVFPTFAASHRDTNMNGSVTIRTIGGVQYAVDESGENRGTYSGWMFRGPRRYFSADGILQTGWQQIGGKGYFFNRDGIMRTGSVMTEWGSAMSVYNFDENGVWDGKAALSTYWYAPKTLGDFLLDHEYPADSVYEVRFRSEHPGFDKELAHVDALLQVLWDHADSELIYDEKIGGDVILINNSIYRGDDDLMLRLLDGQGNLAAPFLNFSQDGAGNAYWYTSYPFGVKLDNPGIYGALYGLMKAKQG